MPVMLGMAGLVGGGVGGMSPMTRTNDSIPSQRSFKAAMGGNLKRSLEESVGTTWGGGGVRACDSRIRSVEGTGGGGGGKDGALSGDTSFD